MKTFHLWLSVPFGIIITLICFSGAMLVFEQELTELTHADLYRVEQSADKPLPLGKLMAIATHSLPEGVSATGITVPARADRCYQVSLSKPRRAYLCIDPYTGTVQGRYERPAFFTRMFLLHRFLLDSMPTGGTGIFWGKLLVGISTLMFVFVLLSGVIIWWPRTSKALKNSLKLVFGKGQFRFWRSLHVAGGMYALLFLLLMALTGLTWSFSWYRTGVYRLFGAETAIEGGYHGKPANQSGRPVEKKNGRPAEASDRPSETSGHSSEKRGGRPAEGNRPAEAPARTSGTYACWQHVCDQLVAANPGFDKITLTDGSASVSFGTLGNSRAADTYTFDAQSGTLTGSKLYRDADRATKIRGWIFSLHTGSWGGVFTRILAFVAALLGALLPLTGYYLWLRRLMRKHGSFI